MVRNIVNSLVASSETWFQTRCVRLNGCRLIAGAIKDDPIFFGALKLVSQIDEQAKLDGESHCWLED